MPKMTREELNIRQDMMDIHTKWVSANDSDELYNHACAYAEAVRKLRDLTGRHQDQKIENWTSDDAPVY